MTIDVQPSLAAPIEADQNPAETAGDTVPAYVVSMDRLARSSIKPEDLAIATAAYDEIMQHPEEKRDELWEFYLQEILPIYRVNPEAVPVEETEEAEKARKKSEARNRHLGNVAWWGNQRDKRYRSKEVSLSDRADAIDARYEFRKKRALAAGEEWNEAFAPWPQR